MCQACQRVYSREHHAANNERALARRKARRPAELAEKRALVLSAKDRPCTDCDVSYPAYVMQFDHRDPSQKWFTISSSMRSRTIAQLRAEIAKCDVVCANCHAERTHQQRILGILPAATP